MNDFEPIKFKIMMSASTEIDHVIVEDINQKFIKELSECNHQAMTSMILYYTMNGMVNRK